MAFDDPLKVRLKMVRFSYPHVFKAKGFGKKNTGDPKFSITGIIDPNTKSGQANMDAMEAAIEEAARDKWGKDWEKVLKKLRKDGRVCLREGDEDMEETDGMFTVTASNEKKPLALDENGDDITEADDVIYPGCYGDIIVRVWAQDNDWGQRVNASLEGVKFRKDGEPLSSVSRASREDFEDDDDDDDDRGSRRSSGRGRSRDEDDDDRGSRRSSGRGRSRDDDDDDDDEKPRGRGRSRDDDDDDDNDRGSRRSSGRSRGRSRDDDDDDEPKGRSRGRSRDDDDDDEKPRGRGRARSRDDDDDEPKSRSRGRSRSREDDDY